MIIVSSCALELPRAAADFSNYCTEVARFGSKSFEPLDRCPRGYHAHDSIANTHALEGMKIAVRYRFPNDSVKV